MVVLSIVGWLCEWLIDKALAMAAILWLDGHTLQSSFKKSYWIRHCIEKKILTLADAASSKAVISLFEPGMSEDRLCKVVNSSAVFVKDTTAPPLPGDSSTSILFWPLVFVWLYNPNFTRSDWSVVAGWLCNPRLTWSDRAAVADERPAIVEENCVFCWCCWTGCTFWFLSSQAYLLVGWAPWFWNRGSRKLVDPYVAFL